MTRATAREIAAHLSYEWGFASESIDEFLDRRLSREYFTSLAEEFQEIYGNKLNQKQAEYIRTVVRGVAAHWAELNGYIEKYSKDWEFSRISLMASAVMRVAMYEVLYLPEVPGKVALDEAVKLMRKYGEPETVKFLNGILGSFARNELPELIHAQSPVRPQNQRLPE